MFAVRFRLCNETVLEIKLPCEREVSLPEEFGITAKVHLTLDGVVVEKQRIWATDYYFFETYEERRHVVEGVFLTRGRRPVLAPFDTALLRFKLPTKYIGRPNVRFCLAQFDSRSGQSSASMAEISQLSFGALRFGYKQKVRLAQSNPRNFTCKF